MPVLAHFHHFGHVPGGLQCDIPPCTAFMSPATLVTNTVQVSGQSTSGKNSQDNYNNAWKKSGGQ